MNARNLQTFNFNNLEELRELRGERDLYRSFWEELEIILKHKIPEDWKKMDKDEIVVGDVWQQRIGEFFYKHTVHKFSYLYVETQGLAIGEHRNEEPANNGKQIRKLKEWYFFPDGKGWLCDKDELHQLVNHYGRPIYVLSVKIGRNGNR